jgi:hypothetical protein
MAYVYGKLAYQHLNDMRFLSTSILASSILIAFLWILLLIWFFPDPASARYFSLMEKCETFERAEELAKSDFTKGKFTLILSFGNNEEQGLKRNAMLKEKYNIEVFPTRCVTTSELHYYSSTMMRLLYEKHGEEFIKIIYPDEAVRKRRMSVN